MANSFICSSCGASVDLPADQSPSQRVRCPQCGAMAGSAEGELRSAVLPASAPEAKLPPVSPLPPPRAHPRPRRDEDEEPPEQPLRRRDRSASRGTQSGLSGAVVALFVLLVLVGLGGGAAVLGLVFWSGGSSSGAMKGPVVVTVPRPAGPGPVEQPMMPGGGLPGGEGGGAPLVPLPVQVGQAAPEIEGEDLDSKKMKLSDFRGQVVVLDFWGHWCPFCQRAYSYQGNLLRRMAGRPFVLLGVNCDQTKEQAQLVVKNHKITWRSWWDCGPNMDGPIYTRWGVRAVPCTYVIDHAGIVRQRFEGMPDETVLDRAVDEVLAALDNRPAGVPPRWEPASTPFAGLATEVAAGPYRLRLPAGYVTEKTDPKKGEQLFAWKGPVRPGDGTAPRLAVMLRPADPAMKLEEAVEKELAELSFPRQGWSCSIAERGEVKGLVFARVGWSGRDPTTRQQVQGFLYLGLDGKTLIRITARDVQPHALPALTVAEAAALTFHRAGP